MLTKELHSSLRGNKLAFSEKLFEEQAINLAKNTASKFKSVIRLYALLNIGFFLAGLVEFFSLIFLLPFLAKTLLIAFMVAAVFLTIFSYFVVRFYLQAKKPEQLQNLLIQFGSELRKLIPFEKPSLEYTRYTTAGIEAFLRSLAGLETSLYKAPPHLTSFQPLLEKFSIWAHFQDVQEMREMLHAQTISQCIDYVKAVPLDPAAHAALADAFIELYKIYLHPHKLGKEVVYSFITDYYTREEILKKFKETASSALEELKIVATLKASDPWVHVKLATIYHHLNLPENEIKEYEKLVQLSDNNSDFLLRLGILYFQEQKQTEGLKVYQHLKKSNSPQAEELIRYYRVLN